MSMRWTKIKIRVSIVAAGMVLGTCGDHFHNTCIDLNRVKPVACYDIYQPVCGCNGVTYGNDCYARAAGLKRWKAGACSAN